METNKVTVKIYGQEYVISGDSSREQIMRVADFVDGKMDEIERAMGPAPVSKLAVLTCLNMVDELFTAQKTIDQMEETNRELLKECEHYNQLWEEAKNNHLQYKEDAQISIEKLEKLQKLFNEKTIEMNRADQSYRQLEDEHKALKAKYEELMSKMQTQEVNKENIAEEIKEWEKKCREMENSFFDLQMENIKLKGEIDRYKKIIE